MVVAARADISLNWQLFWALPAIGFVIWVFAIIVESIIVEYLPDKKEEKL